jgi:SAM-dependent methyltransferase
MSHNSILGRTAVVRAMLASPKTPFLASALERRLFPWIGPAVIRLFGWPLWLHARLVDREVLGFLRGHRGKLLDAGGSYGPHAFELARRGWEVTVIDIDQDNLVLGEAIKQALGASGVSFRYGDLCASDLPDAGFDAVLGCEIIEHLKDDQVGVRELGRILKPGGLMVLSTPCAASPEEHPSPHLACAGPVPGGPYGVFVGGGHWRSGYNEENMARLLESNGFTIEALSCIRLPRLLPRSGAFFPVTYPLSLLASPFIRNKVGLVVKARKL